MGRRAPALAGLSGLLLAASFPAVDISVLAWFGLVPLMLSLRDRSPRQAFMLGGLTGMVFFAATLSWIANPLRLYGHVPLLPAAVTVLFSAYCALYPALFAAAAVRLKKCHPALFFLAAPALWSALELARASVLSGFPWLLLGYSQDRHPMLIQIADIAGVYGISFLLVSVNIGVAGLVADRKDLRPLIASAVLLAAVLGYGSYRLTHTKTAESIRISVVQGNVEQDKKWDPVYQNEVIAAYKRLTEKALGDRPDLLIWPETATPFYFGGIGDNAVRTDDLRRFVASTGTPLLFGSATAGMDPDRTVRLRNCAFFLDGGGAVDDVYVKRHLVPFGEYVPLKKSLLFFADKLVQGAGDFEAGSEYTVVGERSSAAGKNIPVSTVICYEVIFPDLVRQFVDRGARVLTTVTNDAWFGRTAMPYQHFAMAVFRAVENHVPIARAANTGISGFIDANGRILVASNIFTEAVLTQTVTAGAKKTFYTRYGDVFSYLCLLASITLLALPSKSKN